MSIILRSQNNNKPGTPKELLSKTFYLDVNFKGSRSRIFYPGGARKEDLTKDERKRYDGLLQEWYDEQYHKIMRGVTGLPSTYQDHLPIAPELEKYQTAYANADIKKLKAAIVLFNKFIGKNARFSTLTDALMQKWIDNMDQTKAGATTRGYWKKIRAFLIEAHTNSLCKYNIEEAKKIQLPAEDSEEKEWLSMEEVAKLAETACKDNRVKYAFLFSCYTGLDFGDTTSLMPENIVGDLLIKQRNKSIKVKKKGRKAAANIKARPLHPVALQLIALASRTPDGKHIFDLPGREQPYDTFHLGCKKILQSWVLAAEIPKHITWHCARHTFLTNLEGDDITRKFLGQHSKNSKVAARYHHAVDEKVIEAVRSLPTIIVK